VNYDNREALQLVADFAERHDPDTAGRREAAKALLEALRAVPKAVGIECVEGVQGLVVSVDGRSRVVVCVDNGGEIVIDALPGKYPVRLQYNRVTKQLEGDELDTYLLPEPGKSRSKRAALAVLVEAILGAKERAG